jgi:Spy/CpxP family protein refolding chaperone
MGTSSAAVSSATGSNSAAASASGARHRGAVRISGVGAPIFRAANALELTPEQQAAYEKIGTDMREAGKADADAGAGPRAAMKDANSLLSAGVKAGKIDTAKVDAQQALLDKAAKARQERESEALNRLYATLDAGQRTKVVGVVRGEEEKRAARMKGRDAGAGPNFTRMRFEGYTRDLELDADQQKKVDAILPKDDAKTTAAREEGKKQLELVLAAFEKEGFDAKKIQPDPKKAIRPMEDLSKFLSQLIPILKPPQREKLAAKLEKASEDHGRPHRGPGGRHDPRFPESQEEDDDVE